MIPSFPVFVVFFFFFSRKTVFNFYVKTKKSLTRRMTPFITWFEQNPTIDNLHTFGEEVFVNNRNNMT